MRVVLTREEVAAAVGVGTFHTIRCILRKAEPKNRQPRHERLDATVEGYLAEAAVARCVGVAWPQPHTISWEGRDKGDILLRGRILEVRGTKGPTHTHLLGQPDDRDDRLYVLVIPVDNPDALTFDVVGYMVGEEMKAAKYWKERVPGRPCYWVPRGDLTSFPYR